MERSNDYHDYVFKDGKLVGAFDDMYKYSSEVPWHQDVVSNSWIGSIARSIIEAAFEDGGISTVLETGCGLGYVISKLADKGAKLNGFDISPVAVEKASKLHPHCNFFVDDLVNLKCQSSYDLVICKENLWYVTGHIDTVIGNLWRLVAPGKYLYVGLSFPRESIPYVGKDVLPNPEALIGKLEKLFDSIAVNLLLKNKYQNDGPNLDWIGKKR